MHCTKCKKEGHNKRKCLDDPTVKEKLANPKKSEVQGNATLPEENDDTWLTDIDIDDVVSQFLPTQTQAEEIQLTSQLPPVGEEDDSQEQVHKALESKKAKERPTGRKYMTRRSVQSKFNNTQDDPIDIQ
nr:uncharacterized protein LOC109190937 [Ipomoea batatas]